ncbi:unnamed protein product, partial [Vitis vinifera]
MAEAKDPAIKLFGKTIPLPEVATAAAGNDSPSGATVGGGGEDWVDQNRATNSSPEEDCVRAGEEGREVDKDTSGGKVTDTRQEDGARSSTSEEFTDPDANSGVNENPKTPSADKETATLKCSKNEEEQSETSISQEKTLKKPDKILPCPRCNSMDTKFCYYNNYNVNQPRHFCKNCQRYWTAGGTMRNVPVGAGRRKNKNSTSHYRHITVSEALQSARTDVPNGIHHPALKTNGTVLTFGSDTPLCESMASVLNLAEKTMRNCTPNGFHKPEKLRIPVPYGDQVMRNLPPPAFCPSGFPMPFYPAAAYWGCTVPGAWNIPWVPQPSALNHTAPSSGPNSPTLGKHSRDENMLKASNFGEEELQKENNSERSDEKNHIAETSPVLQANPAALSRSLNFHESS